jgi:molybdopterin molybdotransferase
MISFDEAIALIASVSEPLGIETVALADASHRVLAAPVIARIDSPRADVSSMDGYAVREEDLGRLPARLRVVGVSSPGAGWSGTVAPGTCARIFTGAPVPAGADRVIIQENVRRDGEVAVVDEHSGVEPYIRQRGSDFAVGDELLPAGRILDPRALVAAAAADVGELEVYRQPRLHILSTGDELAEPGSARETVEAIPDSVTFGVAALAEQWGARCVGRSRLRDDLASMQSSAFEVVQGADVIVVTGGASVGEKDFAKAMFEPLGLQLIFSKVAIKPGKPAWLGRADRCLVVGLPGNPTSAMVTARLMLTPLLSLLGGRELEGALDWTPLPLASPLQSCGARETFHRASLRSGTVEVLSFQDSGAQKALADADVLVRQAAHSPAVPAGAMVEIIAF